MRFKTWSLLFVLPFFLLACDKKQTTCTAASTDPQCNTGGNPGADDSLLQITFEPTYHFDLGTNTWTTLSADQLKQGIITSPIYVYSSYINLSLNEALNSVIAAKDQQGQTNTNANQVPYIEFDAKSGVTYLYRYQKYDLSGTLLSDVQGTVPVQGSRALLPLTNASFNQKYYSSTDPLGQRYKNVISLTAQTSVKTGAIYQIQFQSIYSSQNVDFDLVFSDAMNSFSLENRWQFYKNQALTGPNTNLSFFTLKDKKNSATLSLTDVRVLFKSAPKLQIKEEVFFELPFQADLFKLSGTVVPDRGNKFYVAPVALDSNRDFKMNVFLGGELLSQDSKAFQKLSFPIGKKYDIGFSFDLTENTTYGALSGDPNTKRLLYPLKPVCWELKNETYEPWVVEPLKAQALASNNYYAVCDLDETKTVGPIPPDLTKMDTWFGFFSYAPQRLEKNELGHLFGLRSVSFVIEACIRLQVKAPGTSTWTTTTVGAQNCGGIDSELWTPVFIEKTFTIYDNIASYKNTLNLSSILERFKSSAVETYTNMKINNEILDGDKIRHLY